MSDWTTKTHEQEILSQDLYKSRNYLIMHGVSAVLKSPDDSNLASGPRFLCLVMCLHPGGWIQNSFVNPLPISTKGTHDLVRLEACQASLTNKDPRMSRKRTFSLWDSDTAHVLCWKQSQQLHSYCSPKLQASWPHAAKSSLRRDRIKAHRR